FVVGVWGCLIEAVVGVLIFFIKPSQHGVFCSAFVVNFCFFYLNNIRENTFIYGVARFLYRLFLFSAGAGVPCDAVCLRKLIPRV
ncbi:hypothetical protein ACNISP_26600, partial [Escherichia coli]